MNDQNVVMDRAEDSGEFSSLSLFAFTCRGREKWIRMPSVQMQFSLVLLVLKNSFNKLPKYPDTNYVFPAAFFFSEIKSKIKKNEFKLKIYAFGHHIWPKKKNGAKGSHS